MISVDQKGKEKDWHLLASKTRVDFVNTMQGSSSSGDETPQVNFAQTVCKIQINIYIV